MRNELLLSILIPVYNVEEYLPDCLDSCLDQGLNETEYEIICVDDGSTDHSLDVLSAYAASHKNIIVLSKENGGVSSARNYALDHAEESMFGSSTLMIIYMRAALLRYLTAWSGMALSNVCFRTKRVRCITKLIKDSA